MQTLFEHCVLRGHAHGTLAGVAVVAVPGRRESNGFR
jgi:hypothetical protein